MNTKRALVGLLVAGFLTASIVPSGARSSAVAASLELNRTSVQQGRSVTVIAHLSNPGGTSDSADILFYIRPTAGGDQVPFERFRQSMPGGGTIDHEVEVTSGQWFAETGEFEVTAVQAGSDTLLDAATFDVQAPSITPATFEELGGPKGVDDFVGDMECGHWVDGAAWGDVDGDDDLDLFLPRPSNVSKLWILENGSFTEEAVARGLGSILGLATGAVFADYDNDGDQDLFVTVDGPNLLYQNDGTGNFTNVTASAGVAGDAPSQSASWGDYDNDGLIDLYVANHVRCNQAAKVYYEDELYHNEGDGTFTDQSALLSKSGSTKGAGFQTVWFDYDSDHDMDLYLANDFYGRTPEPNFLWRNDGDSPDGWKFTNVSVPSNTAFTMNAMGIGAADYDRDMDVDLALSNVYATVLLNNQNDGTFDNEAVEAGVARPLQDAGSKAITWGLTFADFNNDGWEDLYNPAGRLGPATTQPDALFMNSHDGKFLDLSVRAGVADLGMGRGAAVYDYDHDGLQDIYMVNMDGSPRLLHNTTANATNWLEMELQGTTSNRDGCGARITLTSTSGSQMREIYCGGTSVGSGSDKAAHFGLDDDSMVDEIEIRWPSGTVQTLQNVGAGQRITVVEGEDQGSTEPPPVGNPKNWRAWLLTSADQLRPEAPPGPNSRKTKRELRELRDLQDDRTAKIKDEIRFWNNGPASAPWTRVMLDMIQKHRPRVAPVSRILAMYNLALYDSLIVSADSRSAYPRQAPKKLDDRIKPFPRGAATGSTYVPDQAIMAGVAETLLPTFFPNEPVSTFTDMADEAMMSRLYAGKNYRSDVETGRELGHQVAQLFLTYGETDGHNNTVPYRPRPAGDEYWEKTPPAFEDSVGGPVGTWARWILPDDDVASDHIPEPFAYGTPEFMDELNEVIEVEENLTPQQEAIATFWDDGPGTLTPPGHWNDIALDLAESHDMSTKETMRLFGLLNAGLYDAVTSFFQVKYEYWTIRPISAVRRLCEDGTRLCTKAELAADPSLATYPDWFSYITTPNFPSYPSGHSTFSGFAGSLLGYFMPDEQAQLNAQADEAAVSRLYGGIHYRSDNDNGLVLGRHIADEAKAWLEQ